MTDPTNIPNDYQGTLRFAWLDLDLLGRAIAADLSDVGRVADVSVNPRLAITCLDQLGDGPAIYCQGGRRRQAGLEPFVAIVTRAVGINSTQLGLGPDRDSVRNYL